MPADWREFEQMVARIEEALSPKGAIVKSPDRVRDLVTGHLREVDASIRIQVGSTPILITIECRQRDAVQDDTWIEQLATKKAKIGAARTIAVSSEGFSASATKTAALNGIELRTLQDRIEEEIVQQFLSGISISIIVTDYAARTIAFELEDGRSLPVDLFSPELRNSIEYDGTSAVVATEVRTGRAITVRGIVERMDDHDLPQDGSTVTKGALLSFPPGSAVVSTTDGPQLLKRLELVIDFSKRVVPAPATSLFEYAAADRPLKHTLEARGKIDDGQTVRLLVDISSPTLERRPD